MGGYIPGLSSTMMACTVHAGNDLSLGRAYAALYGWVKDSEYQVIGVGKAARSTILQVDLSARTGGGANTRKRDALEQTSTILTQARAFFLAFLLAHHARAHPASLLLLGEATVFAIPEERNRPAGGQLDDDGRHLWPGDSDTRPDNSAR
jgi:hypothetical protein